MSELLIFCIFGGLLLLLHVAGAVAYKIHTKSKKSIFYIINNIF